MARHRMTHPSGREVVALTDAQAAAFATAGWVDADKGPTTPPPAPPMTSPPPSGTTRPPRRTSTPPHAPEEE